VANYLPQPDFLFLRATALQSTDSTSIAFSIALQPLKRALRLHDEDQQVVLVSVTVYPARKDRRVARRSRTCAFQLFDKREYICDTIATSRRMETGDLFEVSATLPSWKMQATLFVGLCGSAAWPGPLPSADTTALSYLSPSAAPVLLGFKPDACTALELGEDSRAVCSAAGKALSLPIMPKGYAQFADVSELASAVSLLELRPPDSSAIVTPKTKLDIEEIWYRIAGGDLATARESIRVFYNRAKCAASYFTENRSGWLTDRGRLYVLLGPPTAVYFDGSQERWEYQGNTEHFTCTFVPEVRDGQPTRWKGDNSLKKILDFGKQQWKSNAPFSF
jgi:GWxTD domain-containing protein